MTKHDYINIINPRVFSLVHPRILSHEDDLTMVCHHGLTHQDLYVTDEVYRLVAKGKAFREAAKGETKHMDVSKNRGENPHKWMVQIMENPTKTG